MFLWSESVILVWYNQKLRMEKAMTREDRVEELLERDRELIERLRRAGPTELPDLLTQRKRIKSQMNLYGPAAMDRWMKQEFAEFTDPVAAQEEARKARWAKHPELLEKMRKAAVG
jgi:hypothetical protein